VNVNTEIVTNSLPPLNPLLTKEGTIS